jgi:hypothetical protein
MRHFRFVLAAVIAPLSAPITIIFLQLIVRGNLSLYNDPDISLIMWSSTVAAYVGLLVAVLPIIHVLQILQRVSLGAIVVAGAISGIVVYLVFQALLGLVLDIPAISLIEVIPIAILSILVASVFGLIAGVNNLREKGIAK